VKRERLASVLDEARESGASPREVAAAVSRVDARMGDRMRAQIREFEVDLVVNRADAQLPGRRDVRPTPGEIFDAARSQLGARLRFGGALADDVAVSASVARGVPVMQLFPGSRFASDIHALVAALFESDPSSATRAAALAALPPEPVRIEERAPLPELPSPIRRTSPGRYLRERREQLGLDLQALHERTRIRHRHLEAIEAERFAALPQGVILREYVRQVADALGVADPAEHARLFIERARNAQFAAEFARAIPRRASARPAAPVREVPSARELAPAPEATAPPEPAPVPAAVQMAPVRRSVLRDAIEREIELAQAESEPATERRAEPRVETAGAVARSVSAAFARALSRASARRRARR
jgi:hypothetical protein